uniref:Uncharacterized protein n=1 Tax=Rhizophora mucronata TaxID=61149 RepID=A0A2P2PPP6_RHIMU
MTWAKIIIQNSIIQCDQLQESTQSTKRF